VAALVGMGGVRPLRIRPHYTRLSAPVTLGHASASERNANSQASVVPCNHVEEFASSAAGK
jgi:hypothetical protein